ncbi:carboxymuconolactone decarboxylase family protein [Plantactinospora sp. GCM10030261]|uniref:carboxymuconolactone decarboxylase family protein n=1 Tax=Plantactinospora sp. GCM10030261 TaxID=3273420 RepID=UPI0036101CCA
MIGGRMASSVLRRQVRYLRPVPAVGATGLVARVYRQIADEMLVVVPPALMHSPAPTVLAAYWTLVREPMIGGRLNRTTKEAAAAAVSVANRCPYCAEMHTLGLYDLSTENNAEAVADERVADITDDHLREVVSWARDAHRPVADPAGSTRADPGGSTRTEPAGLTPASLAEPAARAELIGVVVGFHYLTRMVNVFLPGYLLPPGLAARPKRRLKQGISRALRPTLRDHRVPGRSLSLLPPAELPLGAGWAAGDPAVAGAVARATRAFEGAGERSLSTDVRGIVRDRLADWHGEPPGLGAAWSEEPFTNLSPADRAAGRLAMLTALASYRVDARVVDDFRRHHPGDTALVEATAWASFAAATAIGARLADGDRTAAHPSAAG